MVLLPLRIFLGFISIYAGMGKLCDPVYFDGGDGPALREHGTGELLDALVKVVEGQTP